MLLPVEVLVLSCAAADGDAVVYAFSSPWSKERFNESHSESWLSH